ncbi:hypothetical protein J3459_017004 [Metarhizium acridum]|uniref:Uncharacterized protein n=1 Tax=Metarhizium acridum (strain CQMa 102) TaxID=655827 RepID=E9ECR2_METAQ|nr:uncharacterized protein MAC_07660 [Metarhizium acridum CQMa 102]EFY86279.1 hypothetical protein MAC_07660 [Metarhizium acridum CQMa 102]KAG8410660.1 hypothetical protein J3459_017004 [Metarhizium acridum]
MVLTLSDHHSVALLVLHLESDATSSTAQLVEDLISRGAPLQARAPMLLGRSTRSRSPSHGHGFGLWGSRVQGATQYAASVVRHNETPLHWAAYHGAVGVASSLLAHGADVFTEDDGGNTPARLAAELPLLARDLDARDELLQLFRGAE